MNGGPVLVSLLCAVNAIGAAAQAPGGEADREFARGVALQQRGDLAGARSAYEAALKISPRRIDALSNLGLACAGLHDYACAVGSLEKALVGAPGHPAILFNLGITCLEAGRDEDARRYLAKLVQIESSNLKARHYLGVALLKLGRVEEGIAELEKVAVSQPEDLESVYTLASAYIKDRQVAKAGKLVEGVLSRKDTAESHLVAGSYYMAMENYRQALEEFRRAEQLNPALPELGSSLGSAYTMTGSREAAISLFEQYLKGKPADFTSLGILGWLYLESDRLDDAEKMLNRARELKPDDPDVLFHLARIARQQGQYAEAAGLSSG